MTQRTESAPPTPIERATQDTVESIRHNAAHFYREHNVASQHGTTEEGFRRILAGYFENKSFTDWCRDLGVTDPHDGGEA
jgi:hypothetical protein